MSYIVVDREWRIVAVTDALLATSGRIRENILGKVITDEFADNPDNPDADGEEVLRGALQRVVDEKEGHEFPIQRYDLELDGEFVEKHFKPLNEPVFGDDGEVHYVIHGVEDVTASVKKG
jgi:PAS domain-containing protein